MRVAAVAHHLAGLAHVAELFGKLQEPDFRRIIFCSVVMVVSPIRRGGALRNPDQLRAPPRLSLCRGARNPPSPREVDHHLAEGARQRSCPMAVSVTNDGDPALSLRYKRG